MPALLVLQQRPDSLPTGIITTVNNVTDFIIGYAAALAAIGALSMALIEGWKKLYDARTRFQSKRFTSWVVKSIPDRPFISARGRDAAKFAIQEILQLTTGISESEAEESAARLIKRDGRLPVLHAFSPNPAHAVFSLEIERMMGALQDAADTALMTPETYRHLYAFLTTGGKVDDVKTWFEKAEKGLTDIANVEKPGPTERQQVKDLTDMAARLRTVVKRKLDSFQLYTTDRWASWNQVSSIIVGGLLMFGVLAWMRMRGVSGAPSLVALIPLSLAGGILSPVAKDLVSWLKRSKSG